MLYIRHPEKAYTNGTAREYSLDPGLTEAGKEAARDRFRALVRAHGAPPLIITSPYLRARETAQIANEVITEITGSSVDIIYDARIGEFLGHHKDKDLNMCLRPETLVHKPMPPEHWRQFVNRVRKYVKSLNGKVDPAWCITHGIVIKTIARAHGYEVNYPKELRGIRVSHDGVTII